MLVGHDMQVNAGNGIAAGIISLFVFSHYQSKTVNIDACLSRRIRLTSLFAPDDEPYDLNWPYRADPSEGQVDAVLQILGPLENGTFLEAGANDGEFLSNTLYLERFLGWNGVLVEASPRFVREMRWKHRKAWVVQGCVSPKPSFYRATFVESLGETERERGTSALSDTHFVLGNRKFSYKVDCYPIGTILNAVGIRRLDLVVLDIQGAELGVLRTFPIHEIPVKIFMIEMEDEVDQPHIMRLMRRMGYVDLGMAAKDKIFVREDIVSPDLQLRPGRPLPMPY